MQDQLITNEEIQGTNAFKNTEKCFQQLLMKLSVKKNITYGLISYKATGVIPSTIGGNNLKVLRELIENYEKGKP